MSQNHISDGLITEREDPSGATSTSYDCKTTMLRAERHDEIRVIEIVKRINGSIDVPETVRVTQRNSTYFGPKLKLKDGDSDYMLTAPGPDAELLLWSPDAGPDGFRSGWQKVAEVRTEFADEQPQYDLCPYCGEPLKTLEHERMAAVGQCSHDE